MVRSIGPIEIDQSAKNRMGLVQAWSPIDTKQPSIIVLQKFLPQKSEALPNPKFQT